MDMTVHGKCSGKKRCEESVSTQIIGIGEQHITAKQNIFIFHFHAGNFGNGMHMAGKYHDDTTGCNFVLIKIHVDQTASFLYNNQLSLFMPVVGNTGKVQWNTAQIRVIGERLVCVNLIFFILLKL